MQTECSQDSFDFASLGGRKVTAAFDGGAITSNAGALLLRETDRVLGLSRQAAVVDLPTPPFEDAQVIIIDQSISTGVRKTIKTQIS